VKFRYRENTKCHQNTLLYQIPIIATFTCGYINIRPRTNSDIFASISLQLVAMWESRNQGITNCCASLKLQVSHGGKAELSMWTEQDTGIATVRIATCCVKKMQQQTDLTWGYIRIPLSKHQDCKDVLLATVFINVWPLLTSTSFATDTILLH